MGLLGACGARDDRTAAPPAGSGRLRVVTTILPITLFTRAVAGDCAEVTPLIPPGSSAHAFQARPADLLALRRARVLVVNGLGMETFLARLIGSAENRNLLVIDASRGLTPIRLAAAEGHAGHDHGGGHGEAANQREPIPPDAATPASTAPVNPHVWLDPQRAARQVETIRDGLIQADPGCAPQFRRRAAEFLGRLQQLDREIASQLAPYRGRSFVAFHDVAPYFAQRYGLRAAFLVDVPEVNPSPRDVRRVADLVRDSQLRALLS